MKQAPTPDYVSQIEGLAYKFCGSSYFFAPLFPASILPD
jgi:hypothetical protein